MSNPKREWHEVKIEKERKKGENRRRKKRRRKKRRGEEERKKEERRKEKRSITGRFSTNFGPGLTMIMASGRNPNNVTSSKTEPAVVSRYISLKEEKKKERKDQKKNRR